MGQQDDGVTGKRPGTAIETKPVKGRCIMPLKIKHDESILFIGDSITDCGRRDSAQPLGNGYVRLFCDMALTREPAKMITVINRGIGGNNVDDLRSRWHEDVLLLRPDWLSVKIGINDINQFLCDPSKKFLDPAGFEAIYDQLLALTRRRLPKCRLLLIDPFFMSTDATPHSYRAKLLTLLDDYIAAVRRLSRRHDTRLVRTHDLFRRQLRHRHPDVYGQEPVHPNSTGHLLIAEAVYAALS